MTGKALVAPKINRQILNPRNASNGSLSFVSNPKRIKMEIPTPPSPQQVYSLQETADLARRWTKAMWNGELWKQVHWLGVPVLQWPTDLIVMQELIVKLRPNYIVETGLYLGGTAIYYASILQLLGIDGRVISIDIQINPEARRNVETSAFAKRIHLIEGNSKSDAVHEEVRRMLGGEPNVLVTLDSDHTYAHTLAELRRFAGYVPVGGYLVLFDTICRELADTPKGDPSWTNDSPMTALEEFLRENPAFESDPAWGKLLVTFAPNGFLVRKNPSELSPNRSAMEAELGAITITGELKRENRRLQPQSVLTAGSLGPPERRNSRGRSHRAGRANRPGRK